MKYRTNITGTRKFNECKYQIDDKSMDSVNKTFSDNNGKLIICILFVNSFVVTVKILRQAIFLNDIFMYMIRYTKFLEYINVKNVAHFLTMIKHYHLL